MSGAPLSDRRLAARGVLWGGMENAAAAFVGLLLTPLVVRVSGIEGLGLWGAAWSLAHAAGVFDLGIASAYARFAARAIALRDIPSLNRALGAGAGFYLLLAVLVGASLIAAGPGLIDRAAPSPALRAAAPWVGGGAVLTVLLRAVLSGYRGVVAGAQRLDLLGRIGGVAAVLEGAGAAGCLLSGLGLRGMAINSVAAALAVSVAEAIAAHRLCPGLRILPFRTAAAEARAILWFGARLQATRVAEVLGDHVPRLVLSFGLGLPAAGVYELGARLAGLLRVAGRLPLPVIQPLASRLEALGEAGRIGTVLRHATRFVALLVLPAAALLLLDAPALLAAWTGSAQTAAVPVARFLAAALALGLILSPARLMLRGMGFPGVEALASGTGAAVHLGLALLLAPRFGPAGVAAAALAAATVAGGILLAGARRTGAPLPAEVLRPALAGPAVAALAAAAAGAIVHAIAPPAAGTRTEALAHLLPEAAVLGLVAFGVAIACGAIGRRDLTLLRDAVRSGAGGA